MKKQILLITWAILTNLAFTQNNVGLDYLKILDDQYKDYNIATYKQMPIDIAVSFIGGLNYFTKCINGRVAVLPVPEKETESCKIILQNQFNKKVGFTLNPNSKWKFIIILESSTGFETSSTQVLEISSCANETELKNGGGVKWGDCSDITPLAKGSIYLINTNEKVLLFNDAIRTTNNNMESLMKEFASICANKLLLYLQNENDKKLIKAAANGDPVELNNVLIQNKPNINTIANDQGWTALIISASKGKFDLMKILINYGANVNASLKNGNSSLHFAVQKENFDMVKLLVDNNAIVDIQRNDGLTPLMGAANHNNLEIVKLLVNKGAKINSRKNDGITPLMFAAKNGNYEIVKYLVDNGARLDEKDSEGINALMLAQENNFNEIVDLLKSKSAANPGISKEKK